MFPQLIEFMVVMMVMAMGMSMTKRMMTQTLPQSSKPTHLKQLSDNVFSEIRYFADTPESIAQTMRATGYQTRLHKALRGER